MNSEHFATPEVSSIVLKRLFDKALTSIEIFRFVKDVVNMIDDDGEITLPEASQKLEALGWKKELIDPTILELIRLLSQNNPIQKSDQGYGRDKGSYQKLY
jgi:hypothetical protein